MWSNSRELLTDILILGISTTDWHSYPENFKTTLIYLVAESVERLKFFPVFCLPKNIDHNNRCGSLLSGCCLLFLF
jgi:hypothetical protein